MRPLLSYNLLLFMGLLLFQWLVGNRLLLFGWASCIVYPAYFLLTPIDSVVARLLTAFLMGILMDWQAETDGLHTAATVLLAFVQPYATRLLSRYLGSDADEGGRWQSLQLYRLPFLIYSFGLLWLHHLSLFWLEAASRQLWWVVNIKALASSLFSLICISLFVRLIRT